jgi:hypothetical protein
VEKGDRLTLNNLRVLVFSTPQKCNKAAQGYIGAAWGSVAPGKAAVTGDRLTLNNLGGNESFLPQECKEAAWVYIGAAWGSVAPG